MLNRLPRSLGRANVSAAPAPAARRHPPATAKPRRRTPIARSHWLFRNYLSRLPVSAGVGWTVLDLRARRRVPALHGPYIRPPTAPAALFYNLIPLVPRSPLRRIYRPPKDALPPPLAPAPATFPAIYMALLHALYRMDLPTAWRHYEAVARLDAVGHLPETTFYSLLRLIARYYSLGRGNMSLRQAQSWAVLGDFARLGRPLRLPASYDVLIRVLLMSSDRLGASRVLQARIENGLPPTLATLRAFLSRQVDQALPYYLFITHTFVRLGVQPDIVVYQIIAGRARLTRDLNTLGWTFRQAKRYGLNPTPAMYAYLLDVLTRANFRRRSYETLMSYLTSPGFAAVVRSRDQLRHPVRGTTADLLTPLLRNYMQHAPVAWIANLLALMEDLGLQLDWGSLNRLIIRFIIRSDFMYVVRFYEVAQARGGSLDLTTYQALAQFFHEYDAIELAWDLFLRTAVGRPFAASQDGADLADPTLATPVVLGPQALTHLAKLFYGHGRYEAVVAIGQHLWALRVPEYRDLASPLLAALLHMDRRPEALVWYRRYLSAGVNLDPRVLNLLNT
ncbi:hypothetical protein IWQ60_006899 [Tieghemiomyces parasiticus]|uniref:Uncharacterized protein n=1 Tax=Tieghemiomyces parasiticus TaxID=78921 RepID=A0A9W8A7P0_9FUNG|nr:hypothetical protein IWQ60_006899 [Tieghemiomyces parasiticus]